ncbi:MAG: hypothetical protein ABH832_03985 [bacterium]
MPLEQHPGHESTELRRPTEEERYRLKERIRGGKAVFDEIEFILNGDGVELSDLQTIDQQIRDLENVLVKLMQKLGQTPDDADEVVFAIKVRAAEALKESTK